MKVSEGEEWEDKSTGFLSQYTGLAWRGVRYAHHPLRSTRTDFSRPLLPDGNKVRDPWAWWWWMITIIQSSWRLSCLSLTSAGRRRTESSSWDAVRI
jgi:hypothetical protein